MTHDDAVTNAMTNLRQAMYAITLLENFVPQDDPLQGKMRTAKNACSALLKEISPSVVERY